MKLFFALLVALVAVVSGAEVWEGKKYKNYENDDNFERFLEELGVGYIGRKMASAFSPTVELQKNGDKYKLITSTTFKTKESEFVLNREFEEETMGGTRIKSFVTLEGNKFTHNQGTNPPSIVTREFSENEMIATFKVKDIVTVRKYRAE